MIDDVLYTRDLKNLCYEYSDKISELRKEIKKLQKQNEIMKEALKKALLSAEFFMKFADCNRDSWACKCEFCRDKNSSKNLREARQALKQIEENL